MKIPITGDETSEELKTKKELKRLFKEERVEFNRSETNYIYSLIKKFGGIVPAHSYDDGLELEVPYEFGIERTSDNLVEELERRKLISKVERMLLGKDEFFLFDQMDAKFNRASKHPLGIETYGELKYEAGYEEEKIPKLLEKILSKYDALNEEAKPGIEKCTILARAFVLTCRGEYQCPTSMKRYYRLAGHMKEIYEAGEKIGIRPSYDPERRVKAWIPKLRRELDFDHDAIQKFLNIYREDKRKKHTPVTTTWIAGLTYVVGRLSNLRLTQKEVAEFVGCSSQALREHAKKICRRNNIEY